ncbi:MAG: hypothetical protein RLZZ511_1031 [Cyanobacteriota bacterium]
MCQLLTRRSADEDLEHLACVALNFFHQRNALLMVGKRSLMPIVGLFNDVGELGDGLGHGVHAFAVGYQDFFDAV